MIPTRSNSPLSETDVDATLRAVNWDAILHTVHHKVGATTSQWAERLPEQSGHYIVRFLLLDDDEVIVRLPLYPYPDDGPMTPEIMQHNVRIMASMIASMEYAATHSNIPMPRIIHSCIDPTLDDVQSPYVVMTKAEGKLLFGVWDDMPDAQRDIVLAQVVDIFLELSKLRFDKIGSLFKTEDGGWRVEPTPEMFGFPGGLYTSGTDQYLAITNMRLRTMRHERFGYGDTGEPHRIYWFLRSLVPSLYDDSLDANGFPLCHDHVSSGNILLVDVDTHPRITAILDWDYVATVSTSSFAQYPLFIASHLDEGSRGLRRARDRAVFDRLLKNAEQERFPDAAPSLSNAFVHGEIRRKFEESVLWPSLEWRTYWPIVEYAFGQGPDLKETWNQYLNGLMKGVLKDDEETLIEEADVLREAKMKLGREIILKSGMNRGEFINSVRKYKGRFDAKGKVLRWLVKVAGE